MITQETDAFVNMVLSNSPATEQRLEGINQPGSRPQLMGYYQTEWPTKKTLPPDIRSYHTVASELSVEDGLLIRATGATGSLLHLEQTCWSRYMQATRASRNAESGLVWWSAGVDPGFEMVPFELGGCTKVCEKIFFQCYTHFQVHNQVWAPWNCDTIITIGINMYEVVENYNFEALCGHCC